METFNLQFVDNGNNNLFSLGNYNNDNNLFS